VNSDWVQPRVVRRPARQEAFAYAGDFDACFHAEYVGRVRLATLIVGSQALAEEVVQDAFATLYQKWGSTREPVAYVQTVALNSVRIDANTTQHNSPTRFMCSSRSESSTEQ
jgi:DNA-directed RNA polymerase specialized sigma24 family protein